MFKYRQDTPSTRCLWTKTTRHRENPSRRLPIGSPWCTHYRKADSEAVDLDGRPLKRRVTEEVAQDAFGGPSGYKGTCRSCCETSECRYHLARIFHNMGRKLQPAWWRGMGSQRHCYTLCSDLSISVFLSFLLLTPWVLIKYFITWDPS